MSSVLEDIISAVIVTPPLETGPSSAKEFVPIFGGIGLAA
jgi:hypothetical protein